jgi:PAT family beta-lactamase induction signal transducer AmpG
LPSAFATPLNRLVLSERKTLRFLTLFIFYLNQGVGIGFFGFVIPTWLTVNGVSAGQIATVVSLSTLPWSLKFVSGFLVDRYTFLPMGRRRIWIVGAQIALVAMLILAAILSPLPDEIVLLTALGFAVNLAVVTQDVGVDALAIDIMQQDERPIAAGVMFGAQTIGVAITVGLSGWLLNSYGFTIAVASLVLLPTATILFGLAITEREGERNLPWSKGLAHPINVNVQVKNWRTLLTGSFRAMLLTASLMLIPLLLVKSINGGVSSVFGPKLFTGHAGWSMTSFTNFVALMMVLIAIYTVLFAGKIVQSFGERKVIAITTGSACILALWFGSLPSLWTESWFLLSFVILSETLAITAFVAIIPICMRLCNPAVAGTQFVIYMSIANLGTPIGAYLVSLTAGKGHEQALFWIISVLFACGCAWALFAKSIYQVDGTQESSNQLL